MVENFPQDDDLGYSHDLGNLHIYENIDTISEMDQYHAIKFDVYVYLRIHISIGICICICVSVCVSVCVCVCLCIF